MRGMEGEGARREAWALRGKKGRCQGRIGEGEKPLNRAISIQGSMSWHPRQEECHNAEGWYWLPFGKGAGLHMCITLCCLRRSKIGNPK